MRRGKEEKRNGGGERKGQGDKKEERDEGKKSEDKENRGSGQSQELKGSCVEEMAQWRFSDFNVLLIYPESSKVDFNSSFRAGSENLHC